MARKALVNRNQKRIDTAEKFRARREAAKKTWLDPKATPRERDQALAKLQKMPRDACRARVRNRCALTGRPRGYFRRFGMGRNKLREFAMNGEIPGVIKSSW